jgi:hypothetical protein
MSRMREHPDDDQRNREVGNERDPEVRQAWLDEAERRMDLVRAGKMRLIDADEALADPDYDA